jgi:hypothetical protein
MGNALWRNKKERKDKKKRKKEKKKGNEGILYISPFAQAGEVVLPNVSLNGFRSPRRIHSIAQPQLELPQPQSKPYQTHS